MADAFQDKIDGTGPRAAGLPRIQEQLDKLGKSKQIDLPKSRQYAGFDAYKGVIDECDLVVIATPPGFRPIHFDYAVQQGKHVFMEKPVCVDAWGFNKVVEAAKVADQKNLKVVVGLQRHYQDVYLEAHKKVKAELKKMQMMAPMSAEATVVRNYIDWLLDMPWSEVTKRSPR